MFFFENNEFLGEFLLRYRTAALQFATEKKIDLKDINANELYTWLLNKYETNK